MHPDVLWSDWLTRDLYAFLPDIGIATVTTRFSRFVADVNRDPDGELHGGFWTSVVAARMPNGRAVYRRPLTEDEIGHRIEVAHAPFHRALDEVVGRLLARFHRVLLLDLHSFGVGLDGDVILGDRHGVTASPAAVGLVSAALDAAGLDVRMNQRFAGGWTVRRFAGSQPRRRHPGGTQPAALPGPGQPPLPRASAARRVLRYAATSPRHSASESPMKRASYSRKVHRPR